MLVVRRRAGEAIVLGEDIEIEVIEISRTRVKLGIRAPREVTVLRRESVHIAQENQCAAGLLTARPEAVVHLLRLLEGICTNSPQTQKAGVDK